MGDGFAVCPVDVEEEHDERKAAPAVELEVQVDGHPAAVGPVAEEVVDAGENEHCGEEDADGVGYD